MKKIVTLLTGCIALMFATANAQSAEELTAKALNELGKPQINVTDHESMQSGARLYMDYCLACHSLEFQRYNITARDMGLQEEDIQKLINTGSYDPREAEFIKSKDGDLIYTAMDRRDAQGWAWLLQIYQQLLVQKALTIFSNIFFHSMKMKVAQQV